MGTRGEAEKPVKDVKEFPKTMSEAKERQIVATFSRAELEDRYLRMREENASLKKVSNQQEEKMKLMATKLLRLVKDRKQLLEGGGVVNYESKDKNEALETRIEFVEKQNESLKNKLMVTKQQLQTHGRKPNAYDHVPSRINNGKAVKKTSSLTRQQRIKEQLRVQGTPPDTRESSPVQHPPALPQPRYGHSLLEESRLEKQQLDNLVVNLQDRLHEYEDKIQFLERRIEQKELYHEEDMINLKKSFSGAHNQRSAIQENVELIKLQREVKEKVSKLQSLQNKYQNIEQLLNKVKTSHSLVLEEMEGMTTKLKEEQLKNTNLQSELKHGNISQKTLAHKEEQISDLKSEISILKEAHEKLLKSTFDVEKDRECRAKEKQYQIRIAELEATIKADVSDKNQVLDRLTSERDLTSHSQKQARELQRKYYELQEKHNQLTEKMKFFNSESGCDREEMQEALLLVKKRKEQEHEDLHFLNKIDKDEKADVVKELQQMQAAHADTINELEKTRNMLVLQHNINKDYQKEVEMTTKKMEELKKECDTRVKEYAQLLDVRAQRIKRLEAQMRDVAYGTKQFKVKPEEEEVILESEDSTIQLERGENLFEIHVGKSILTKEALKTLRSEQPNIFVSYEFFEYEIQTTPVKLGASTDFDHTSSYKVCVDDFFLHYLQKEWMRVEMHQAFGTEYRTIATASLKFTELLDRSHGRLHTTLSFVDVNANIEMANVDFWVRLRVPMEQALRLYKERTKALGYITSNELSTLENPTKQTMQDSSINELIVNIVQCQQIVPKNPDVQPSAYCVYKLYDFADHDTQIVQHSNHPQFHDQRAYPLPMTEELDNYLKNASLQVYLFDDLDPDMTSFIGMATIPLITLSQDKPLAGKFQIISGSDGGVKGIVEVNLEWKYTYLPASAKKVRTYPKANDTGTDRSGPLLRASSSHYGDSMRPLVSSGKLYEPHVVRADDHLLQPVVDVQRENAERAEIAARQQNSNKQSAERMGRPQHSGLDRPLAEKPPRPSSARTASKREESSTKEQVYKQRETISTDMQGQQNEVGDESVIGNRLEMEDLKSVQKQQEKPTLVPASGKSSRVPEHMTDTMFEESEDDSDDDVMMPASAKVTHTANEFGEDDEESDLVSEETDDDVVVATARPDTRRAISPTRQQKITIEIGSLTLNEDAAMLNMSHVQQLFVSYQFLDFDPAELETPVSLPKPNPNHPISFNFKRVFHLDEEEHSTSRQYLMHLLMPDHPNEGRVFFTVVSDPGGEEEGECEDVAIAYVDLVQILREGKDLMDADIDIYDLIGQESRVIGTLTVTVEALHTLRALYQD